MLTQTNGLLLLVTETFIAERLKPDGMEWDSYMKLAQQAFNSQDTTSPIYSYSFSKGSAPGEVIVRRALCCP